MNPSNPKGFAIFRLMNCLPGAPLLMPYGKEESVRDFLARAESYKGGPVRIAVPFTGFLTADDYFADWDRRPHKVIGSEMESLLRQRFRPNGMATISDDDVR